MSSPFIARLLRRPVLPTAKQVEEMERHLPQLAGKRVRDVPEFACFRFKFRFWFLRQAERSLGLAIFGAVIALNSSGVAHWFGLFGFANAFVMMFFCEFKAQRLTQELNRRAAEQLLRDMTRGSR